MTVSLNTQFLAENRTCWVDTRQHWEWRTHMVLGNSRCCAAGHWCGEDNHLAELLENVDLLFAPWLTTVVWLAIFFVIQHVNLKSLDKWNVKCHWLVWLRSTFLKENTFAQPCVLTRTIQSMLCREPQKTQCQMCQKIDVLTGKLRCTEFQRCNPLPRCKRYPELMVVEAPVYPALWHPATSVWLAMACHGPHWLQLWLAILFRQGNYSRRSWLHSLSTRYVGDLCASQADQHLICRKSDIQMWHSNMTFKFDLKRVFNHPQPVLISLPDITTHMTSSRRITFHSFGISPLRSRWRNWSWGCLHCWLFVVLALAAHSKAFRFGTQGHPGHFLGISWAFLLCCLNESCIVDLLPWGFGRCVHERSCSSFCLLGQRGSMCGTSSTSSA